MLPNGRCGYNAAAKVSCQQSIVSSQLCSPPQVVHRFFAAQNESRKTSRMGLEEVVPWCLILSALFSSSKIPSCPPMVPRYFTTKYHPMQHLTQRPHETCGREPSIHVSIFIANLHLLTSPVRSPRGWLHAAETQVTDVVLCCACIKKSKAKSLTSFFLDFTFF